MAHNSYPLIIEQHPDNYKGYPFITLIVYGEAQLLTIIDNQDKHNIYAYVLDFCQIEHIDEQLILKIANKWNNNKTYPISIEFAKHNIDIQKIFKTFNINYIKRIIGPVPKYNMDTIKKTKRKKRKIVDTNINVIYTKSSLIFSS